MTPELWLVVVGAAVAGFVQGLSGFGFSMVAMSFWVWGIAPPEAAVLAVFGSLTGQVVGMFSVPRALGWRDLAPFLAGGALGVPLGVALLPHLNPALFKLVFGALLLAWCPVMLFAHGLPRITLGGRAGRAADTAVGAVGGFLGGLGGFTGAAPTLWCTLRGLDKAHQRSIIQNFNLAALAATMVGYLVTGGVAAALLPTMAVVAVALLVPALIGARVYVGLSPLAFRRVVLSLLSLSGAVMVATSLPALLG
jgi:uncharacterized membrane protein YfcA